MKLTDIEDVELPSGEDVKKMPPLDAFCAFWPVIKFALAFVKIFTGKKADAKIDQVIEWGNGFCLLGGLSASKGEEPNKANV